MRTTVCDLNLFPTGLLHGKRTNGRSLKATYQTWPDMCLVRKEIGAKTITLSCFLVVSIEEVGFEPCYRCILSCTLLAVYLLSNYIRSHRILKEILLL